MSRRPCTATGLALAAGSLFVLAVGLTAAPPRVSAESDAHASPWASAAAEARVLAGRILSRESDDLLLDGARLRALGHEIKRALALVRRTYPAMADVPVREEPAPATLVLGLEGALRDAVAARWGEGETIAAPPTGRAAFDTLNAALGLGAVLAYPALGAVVLRLDELANVEAAARAYGAIEGVAYAEPDAPLGDGSDIEAAKTGDTWHVVFRKAWGDCPAGCIYQELSYFTVADEGVEKVAPAQAHAMKPFATLLALRGWR